MEKKKLFSIVSSGVIAFSSGVSPVLANIPSNINNEKVADSTPNEDISLFELINVDTEEETLELLKDVFVSLNEEKELVLYGDLLPTHSLNVVVGEEKNRYSSIQDEDGSFNMSIPTSHLEEESLRLSLSDEEKGIDTLHISLSSLLTDLREIFSNVDEDIEEQTEKDSSESLEKSLEDPVEEESSESNDIHVEAIENEPGTRSPLINIGLEEDSVSLPRSSEIEELLHGEESVISEANLTGFSVFNASTSRTHQGGVYTVVSGDTFYSIANSFGISTNQLRVWNGYSSDPNNLAVGTRLAVTREGVESLLTPAEQARRPKGDSTPQFSTNEEFIQHFAPLAIEIANQNGQEALWPSLMIAQAAHESAYGRSQLASPPYHNLSGIKARGSQTSVLMWTWEVLNGVRVDVLADFRTFPSYSHSLQAYADLLRGGTSWDSNYYSGAWASNTNSVWEVLDNGGLAGYATDPNYYDAIRRTINNYDLTQYDNKSVQVNIAGSQEVASYPATLRSGYSLDTLPWGTTGFQRVAQSADYAGEQVEVVRQAQGGQYLLVRLNNAYLGWADSRAVAPVTQRISNGVDVNYNAVIGASGFSIDSLPWGRAGSQRLTSTSNYNNQEVIVRQETQNGEYVLIEKDGNLLGWVDRRALRIAQIGNPNHSRQVNYPVTVLSGYSVDTLPWGTAGYQRITYTNDYRGQEATAVRETNNGHYILLEQNGNLLGWVDHRAIQRTLVPENVSNSYAVDYDATIVNGSYSIDTLPWGTVGYQRIDWSGNMLNTQIRVTHEFGAYALIELNGSALGWVDRKALNSVPRPGNYSAATDVNYIARLRSGYSIDTLPWGVSGHRRISRTNFYTGQTVRVVRQTGSYALIQINGRNMGWVDRRALY